MVALLVLAGARREVRIAASRSACWALRLRAPEAAAPLRIVSLAPNLTEIAYAAGAGHALVGTVEYSDYPAAARSAAARRRRVARRQERVLALQPDLVLVWPTGTPDATIERLRRLGLQGRVRADLSPVGRAGGAARASARWPAAPSHGRAGGRWRSSATSRRQRAEPRAARRRCRVFIEIDDEPALHRQRRARDQRGGRSCAAVATCSPTLPQIAPPIALEAVLAADPQVIVSTDDTIADPMAQWRRWPRLTAVRAKTIYSLSSDLVTRATPRLAEGVRATCAALDDARGPASGA